MKTKKPQTSDERKEKQKLRMQKLRSNPAYKQKEREAAVARRLRKSQHTDTLETVRQMETIKKQKQRQNPTFREQEQSLDTQRRRRRREDPIVREEEQSLDTQKRRRRREDPIVKEKEQSLNTQQRRTRRDKLEDFTALANRFKENVKDGPIHPCFSCDRLFFKTLLKVTNRAEMINKGCSSEFINEVVLDEFSDEPEFKFCSTCYMAVNKRKFPRFCVKSSNLQYPEIPDALKDISPLEERCISPRIIFMKIYALSSSDRQFGIGGGVVNVPVDVPKMFASIPIRPNQTGTIQLKLKRKMEFKHHYQYETIRPQKIWDAACYLVETPLYKHEENITLNRDWHGNDTTTFNVDEEIDDEAVQELVSAILSNATEKSVANNSGNNERTVDVENENFPEDTRAETYEETLLDKRVDSCQGVDFAPGEGEIPLSILLDKHCEELAFPSIFCGYPRNVNPDAKLSYEDIVNSEIRRRDRRAVRPDHLLFTNKKSQCKQISSGINIALKKTMAAGMTASQALDKMFINNIVSKDNAYRFLSNITGSPAYWEQQKKNVLAMVRQLGIFTLFVTLSAAETHWEELLKILKKTVDNEENANVSDLDYQEKARLIRSDPVTCALYFDYRFKELKKTWNNVKDGPFGEKKIRHMYYRIQFQHRGSPHVHMILWLENAPIFDPENDSSQQSVTDFIDTIISTSSEDTSIENLKTYQYHKCTFTCKKYSKGKAVCRFNAPFLPMDRTRILKPSINDAIPDEHARSPRSLYKSINDLLSGDTSNIGSFEEMLVMLDCSIDEYIVAVRSQLSTAKIFLKREPKDCRINSYSPKILSLMQSNMDIQFVLDPYGCIGYIVDYINKPNRGLSKLLRNCVENFKRGNHSVRQRLKSVANTFYNGTEISAQEAAWCRLRLPMSCSSVVAEFINTLPRKDRQKRLKSEEELSRLDPDSEEVTKLGTIERYPDRPDDLENLCLADFVSEYNFQGSRNSQDEQSIEEICDDDNDDPNNGKKYKFKTLKGSITKRKQKKVIRFCRFDPRKDKINFFREMVMLFKPWRSEVNEVENQDCEQIFLQHKEAIEAKFKEYTKAEFDFNEILAGMEAQSEMELQNEEAHGVDDVMRAYDYDTDIIQPNIMVDMGQETADTSDTVRTFTVPDQLPENEYFDLCDGLNTKQQDYLMHVINEMKCGADAFYHFVSGSAGVGKSRLIKAIYQSIIRLFRQRHGPLETNEVILIAPTGKAAHNIGGMTAHSAFSLAVTQNQLSSKDLTADTLNTLQTKLHNMKILIIDEISMMGSNMFYSIHRRMCQIFRSDKPFGGKTVIAFGDFRQLRPVGDSYVFMPRTDPLASLVGNHLWQNFKLFELTEIMRQKDDLLFAEALSRLAEGLLTNEDIAMFEKRCVKSHQCLPERAKCAIHLFKTKAEVEQYNVLRVRELKNTGTGNTEIKFKAIDKVIGAANQHDKDQALHALEKLPTDQTYGLPAAIALQRDVRYMVTTNVNVSDGLFNGASGLLRFIELSTKGPHALWIEFDDPTVGASARGDRKNIAETLKLPSNYTPLQRTKKIFKPTKAGQAQISREQYPLVVAEGITIHKSQGQSMPMVVVGIAHSMDRSLLYVALSRATSINGLFMIGKFKPPNKPPANYPPTAEMTRLRTYCTISPKFEWMHRVDNSKFIQLISHNVQSITKHQRSISGNLVYMNSHLLLLQETWALARENFEFSGFDEVERNYFSGPPSARGTTIYANSSYSLNVTAHQSFSASSNAQHIDITLCFVGDLKIINIYKSPRSSLEFLKTTLCEIDGLFNHCNVIICGDFNIELRNPNGLEEFLQYQFDLKLLSPKFSTTDGHTTIDAVFGKLENYLIHANIFESYFSYHKPIIVRLYNK